MAISTAPTPANLRALALRAVCEGFHCHDKSVTPTLDPIGAATVGSHVKLQLKLYVAMKCAAFPDEEVRWLAVAGQVSELLGPDRVRVVCPVPKTDRAPLGFEGVWIAELARLPVMQFPWILADIHHADGGTRGLAFDQQRVLFKIACAGDPRHTATFLQQLAAVCGGSADHDSVVLSLPVPDRSVYFVVCGSAGELAASDAAQELALAGADAVLFATDDPATRAGVAARLARRGRSLDTLVQAACSSAPLDVMKRVAKQLLSLHKR